MNNLTRKTLLGCFALLLPCLLYADDFGGWTSIGVEKKLGKFTLATEGELRFNNHFKTFARKSIAINADYKLAAFLKLGVGYSYMYDYTPQEVSPRYKKGELNGFNVDEGFNRSKHRFFVQLTGKYSLGRFTFKLRERYQYTRMMATNYNEYKYRGYVNRYEHPEQYGGFGLSKIEREQAPARNRHLLRSRLEINYNIRRCAFDPFVSFELSNNLSRGFRNDKERYIAGVQWTIAKPHQLSLSYVFNRYSHQEDNDNSHAISLEYTYSF